MFAASPTSKLSEAWPTTTKVTKITTTKTKTTATATAHETQTCYKQTPQKKKQHHLTSCIHKVEII
jgi:hypothetical protein